MSSKSKKAKRNKKIVRNTVLGLAVIMLVVSALLFMQAWEKNRGLYSDVDDNTSEVIYNGKEYELKDNIETFMILGLDKFENFEVVESYNNDKQADFIMLFVFDHNYKTCTAVQINRDTMADVSVLGVAGNRIDTVTQQIALSHTYGNGRDVSCRNTADSVSKLLMDMKVNHYVSVTMDAVKIINDYVGGVEVKVLNDFTDIDDSFVKGKKITLKGDQALKYVRARQGLDDSSNVARMKRQRQYIEALYEKFLMLYEKDKDVSLATLKEISGYMVSDRSITQMQELADKFIEYEFDGIRVIEGDNLKGEKYMEFYPYESSVKEIVFDLFYSEKTA